MRRALQSLDERRRTLVLGAVALVACVAALGVGRALTAPPSAAPTTLPATAALTALDRLDAGLDPLERATARARTAVAAATVALGDDTERRRERLTAAREEAVAARLALLALEDGASDDERRAIGEANRALQRLVLQLDTARREG